MRGKLCDDLVLRQSRGKKRKGVTAVTHWGGEKLTFEFTPLAASCFGFFMILFA